MWEVSVGLLLPFPISYAWPSSSVYGGLEQPRLGFTRWRSSTAPEFQKLPYTLLLITYMLRASITTGWAVCVPDDYCVRLRGNFSGNWLRLGGLQLCINNVQLYPQSYWIWEHQWGWLHFKCRGDERGESCGSTVHPRKYKVLNYILYIRCWRWNNFEDVNLVNFRLFLFVFDVTRTTCSMLHV